MGYIVIFIYCWIWLAIFWWFLHMYSLVCKEFLIISLSDFDTSYTRLLGHLMKKNLTHWKRPWCWERLQAGGEGEDTGWDGWMASPTQWTWVLVSSRSWWWTGKPGMLQSMGLQRVGHDWTELNWKMCSTTNQVWILLFILLNILHAC